MAFHHESQITEKEQISLLQNDVGRLHSSIHLGHRHITKIETLIKWLCLGFIILLGLTGYLIILHVS